MLADQRGASVVNFSDALQDIKKGLAVCREGWNGKGMWIALQMPDPESKMTLPYIFMRTADRQLVPWLASQTDILADDWRLAALTVFEEKYLMSGPTYRGDL